MFYFIPTRVVNTAITLTSPDAYSISTGGAINFNWTVVDSVADANHTNFNCSIYSKTSRAGSFVENVSDVLTTNASWINRTISYNDADRAWWYISCEDKFAREIISTSTSQRIMDIDTDYYTLSLGANKVINFTLDTGHATFTAGITITDFIGTYSGGTAPLCIYDNGSIFPCD